MNPDRRAMINGSSGSSATNKSDITSPRRDPNNRITKPSRPTASKPSAIVAAKAAKYLTVDQQSERFVADEDKFVLKQSKKKADIRVREQRAKPIDLLAFSLRWTDADRDVFDDNDEDVEIDVPAPGEVLAELNEQQLKELAEDIKSFDTLETNPQNREYWRSLMTLVEDRRQKLKPQGAEGRAVNTVAAEIDKVFSPKTYEQLEVLEGDIEVKLQSNEPIDTDYWQELLKSLRVWKAKAKLKKICEAVRDARVEILETRDPEMAQTLRQTGRVTAVAASAAEFSRGLGNPGRVKQSGKAKSAGGGLAALAKQGTSVTPNSRFASTGNEDFTSATKALYDREMARGLGDDEEIFQAEELIPSLATPQWADKYRPRRPRYFNRVKMGYEWNKYNQTHYDHDNPPPRVVQGYKFNIFYPDLIDKTKAPTFKIIREHGRRRGESFAPAGEEDTCLIRFIAGPPYEDIAFRIVDREWDYSAKKERGFKSSFDKGILQLHFQFKKIFYRK